VEGLQGAWQCGLYRGLLDSCGKSRMKWEIVLQVREGQVGTVLKSDVPQFATLCS
jgi:hypothetical protein